MKKREYVIQTKVSEEAIDDFEEIEYHLFHPSWKDGVKVIVGMDKVLATLKEFLNPNEFQLVEKFCNSDNVIDNPNLSYQFMGELSKEHEQLSIEAVGICYKWCDVKTFTNLEQAKVYMESIKYYETRTEIRELHGTNKENL